jgi:mRNA deadenylase 3'-5' endonuclease subunit Ccr4
MHIYSPCTDTSVKVVSYNILGPMHAVTSKHDYAKLGVRKWKSRGKKLLEQIECMAPDVLCLQELSLKAYVETFRPRLAESGLSYSRFA